MNHLGLVCAAMALGIFASPVGAQQTTPDEPVPSTQQNQAAVPPAPPPDRQTSPEMPPPFPPMPKRAPQHRFVDMGEHYGSHAHHRTSRTHHAAVHQKGQKAHHHGSQAHAAATKLHRKAARERHAAAPTPRTERRCLGLSLSQALKRSNCKAVIQQKLEAGHDHRRAHHKAPRHDKQRRHARRHHSS